jgi:hypothetical protein
MGEAAKSGKIALRISRLVAIGARVERDAPYVVVQEIPNGINRVTDFELQIRLQASAEQFFTASEGRGSDGLLAPE